MLPKEENKEQEGRNPLRAHEQLTSGRADGNSSIARLRENTQVHAPGLELHVSLLDDEVSFQRTDASGNTGPASSISNSGGLFALPFVALGYAFLRKTIAPDAAGSLKSLDVQSNAAFQAGFANGATLANLQSAVPAGFSPPENKGARIRKR